MSDNDLALTAHLMRRAGFGATREELEELSTRSYESLVDDLIDPERFPQIEDDVLDRYYGEITIHNNPGTWLYRMVNTRRPLEEKMVLFLHQVFATAYSKDSAPYSHLVQLDLFRRVALSDWRTILIEVSKDPLMISWLDNSENHKDEPQRELRPGSAGAVLDGHRKLHGGRRQGVRPRVHRVDVRAAHPALSLRPLRYGVRVPGRGPRRRPKVVPGTHRQLQRRGHHRHNRPSAGDRRVRDPAPVQLLRGGRAAGSGMVGRAAARPQSHRRPVAGVHRHGRQPAAGASGCCSTPTSSRRPATPG